MYGFQTIIPGFFARSFHKPRIIVLFHEMHGITSLLSGYYTVQWMEVAFYLIYMFLFSVSRQS